MTRQGLLSILFLAALANAGANVLLKAAARGGLAGAQPSGVWGVLRALGDPLSLLGLAGFGIAFVLYKVVLSRMELSVAYPLMTGAGFVLVLAASALGFREALTWQKAGGVALIVAGMALTYWRS